MLEDFLRAIGGDIKRLNMTAVAKQGFVLDQQAQHLTFRLGLFFALAASRHADPTQLSSRNLRGRRQPLLRGLRRCLHQDFPRPRLARAVLQVIQVL